jgi:hypothetical protein
VKEIGKKIVNNMCATVFFYFFGNKKEKDGGKRSGGEEIELKGIENNSKNISCGYWSNMQR